MRDFITYILSVFMTLLPPRYRAEEEMRGPAIVCAVAQVMVCVFGLIFRAILFGWHGGSGLPDGAVVRIAGAYGERGLMLSGVFALVDFWFQPPSIILEYFVIEGVVRFAAALSAHQTLGTLPLYAVSGVHNLIDRAKYRRDLGPLVPDEVIRRTSEKQNYELKVYSCRPKLHWNPYMTIEFEGEFYQMFKEEPASGPRRFIYYLRKNPVGRIVVTIDRYKPDSAPATVPDR